jgi:hypothetical protein
LGEGGRVGGGEQGDEDRERVAKHRAPNEHKSGRARTLQFSPFELFFERISAEKWRKLEPECGLGFRVPLLNFAACNSSRGVPLSQASGH